LLANCQLGQNHWHFQEHQVVAEGRRPELQLAQGLALGMLSELGLALSLLVGEQRLSQGRALELALSVLRQLEQQHARVVAAHLSQLEQNQVRVAFDLPLAVEQQQQGASQALP